MSNVGVGAAAGGVSALIVGGGWHMMFGMLVGMICGMAIALLLDVLLFMRYFGAMEVMVPTMLGGMLAGMVVGMGATMDSYPVGAAAGHGGAIGLAALAFCSYANYIMQGVAEDKT